MIKFIRYLAVSLALVSSSALALETSSTFSVNLNLAATCQFMGTAGSTVGGTIDALALNYTSFQSTAATGSTSFKMRCTNNQSYTVKLDNGGTGSYTDSTTGLQYTLNLSSASSHTSGTNTSLTGTGAGATLITYYVHGTAAANQGGTAGTVSSTRTLTIEY